MEWDCCEAHSIAKLDILLDQYLVVFVNISWKMSQLVVCVNRHSCNLFVATDVLLLEHHTIPSRSIACHARNLLLYCSLATFRVWSPRSIFWPYFYTTGNVEANWSSLSLPHTSAWSEHRSTQVHIDQTCLDVLSTDGKYECFDFTWSWLDINHYDWRDDVCAG